MWYLQHVLKCYAFRGATYGSCVEVTGHLIKSPGPAQLVELQIDDIKVLGTCNGMVGQRNLFNEQIF